MLLFVTLNLYVSKKTKVTYRNEKCSFQNVSENYVKLIKSKTDVVFYLEESMY